MPTASRWRALLRVPQGGGTERFAALNAALCPDALLRRRRRGRRAARAARAASLRRAGASRGMSHPRVADPRGAPAARARIIAAPRRRRRRRALRQCRRRRRARPTTRSCTSTGCRQPAPAPSTSSASRRRVGAARARSWCTTSQLGGVARRGSTCTSRLAAPRRRSGADRAVPGRRRAAPRHARARRPPRARARAACRTTAASPPAAAAASSTARRSCTQARRSRTRASRAATCCSRRAPRSTPSPSSRSTPTTCSAATARRPASSTRRRSSTCARAASTETEARSALTRAFAGAVLSRMDHARAAPRRCTTRSTRAWRACWRRRHERRCRPRRPRRAARRRGDPRATSRCSRARCTASRSATSTTPPRASARSAVIDADLALLRDDARQRAPRRAHAEPGGHRPVRGRAREACAASSTPARRARSSSCAARPRRSTSSRRATRGRGCRPGDEILISWLEHHANIVPWQMVCEQTGATLRVDPDHRGRRSRLRRLRSAARRRARGCWRWRTSRTRSAPSCRSQRFIARGARAAACPVLLDGAQAVPHLKVDVQALDCDFYCFSGHKMCGPTGIGVLYGREALLRGDAAVAGRRRHDPARSASSARSTTTCPTSSRPARRTSPAPSASARRSTTSRRSASTASPRAEHALLEYATASARRDPGPARSSARRPHKAAVVSFTLDGVHPHDLGTILDSEGVAIRTGHHCAMPVMEFFGVPATARASFAFYNTRAEIDRLVAALPRAREMLG